MFRPWPECFSLFLSVSVRLTEAGTGRQHLFLPQVERLSVPAQTCGSSGWEQLCRATKSHRVPRQFPGVLFHEQLQLLNCFFHVSVSERRMMKGCLLSPLMLSLHSSHSFPSQWFLIAIMWPNIWTWVNKWSFFCIIISSCLTSWVICVMYTQLFLVY